MINNPKSETKLDTKRDTKVEIKQQLTAELGVISYIEMQKFFAKGIILVVDPSLNIIDAAFKIHCDDSACIEGWIHDKLLTRAHDEHAKKWLKSNTSLQAVTVAPWVVVQEQD